MHTLLFSNTKHINKTTPDIQIGCLVPQKLGTSLQHVKAKQSLHTHKHEHTYMKQW